MGVAEEGQDKECLICLTETRSVIIMPCGHLCVCSQCGTEIHKQKYTCPICRGPINSLVPFDLTKVATKR